MKKIILAAALSLGLAAPAIAGQCPGMITKIEEAMKTATLDDAGKAKVTELVAKGKGEHDAGDHAASEATLGEAMKMLGI